MQYNECSTENDYLLVVLVESSTFSPHFPYQPGRDKASLPLLQLLIILHHRAV